MAKLMAKQSAWDILLDRIRNAARNGDLDALLECYFAINNLSAMAGDPVLVWFGICLLGRMAG